MANERETLPGIWEKKEDWENKEKEEGEGG